MTNTQNHIFDYYACSTPKIRGLISIPHSGEIIPEEFLPFLSPHKQVRDCDLDFRVDHLVDISLLNQKGIGVLVSNIHRAAVDLNRSQNLAVFNWKKNSKGEQLVVSEPDEKFYHSAQVKYYLPYYTLLDSLIKEIIKNQEEQGKPSLIIDLHSMPSVATDYHLKYNPNQKRDRPNFCISDLKGKSCNPMMIKSIQKFFNNNFGNSTINTPYFGGYVTQHIHEKFQDTVNNIQIEIKRNQYMDEAKIQLKDKSIIGPFKEKLTSNLIQSFDLTN